MELRQPDGQITAAEVAVKADTAHHPGCMQSRWPERIFAEASRQGRGSARVGVRHRSESMTAHAVGGMTGHSAVRQLRITMQARSPVTVLESILNPVGGAQ